MQKQACPKATLSLKSLFAVFTYLPNVINVWQHFYSTFGFQSTWFQCCTSDFNAVNSTANWVPSTEIGTGMYDGRKSKTLLQGLKLNHTIAIEAKFFFSFHLGNGILQCHKDWLVPVAFQWLRQINISYAVIIFKTILLLQKRAK